MRLRKKVISVLLSACMAVTVFPSGMPLKAVAAEVTEETTKTEETVAPEESGEEIEVLEVQAAAPEGEGEQPEPEVLPEESTEEVIPTNTKDWLLEDDGYGTIALVDEEVGKNKISRDYIPTREAEFSFSLYLTEKPYTDENAIIVYLFDQDNKMAAKSVEPAKAENYGGEEWNLYFNSVYRARELKAGEILYVGYKNDNGEIQKLKNLTVTVTDQPYIDYISYGNRRYYGDYADNGEGGLYAGSDNTSIVTVSGYNTDFSKLGLRFRDSSTGNIVAESTSYMEYNINDSYYCMEWVNAADQYQTVNYAVEYTYSESEKSVVAEKRASSFHNYSDRENKNIIWNPKKDTVEYYNKEIPAGTSVSYEIRKGHNYGLGDICVSGSSITVSSSHLITINLKDKLPSYNYGQEYTLNIRYEEDGQEKNCYRSFYVYTNTRHGVFWSVDGFHTTDDNKIEISVGIYPDTVLSNESKFKDTCTINIFKFNTVLNDDIVGKAELKLRKEDNKISYYGIYNGKLDLGEYGFSLSPDEEHTINYVFNVYDKNKLYFFNQLNNITSGTIKTYLETPEMAKWYFKNLENLNKIKIKILDIEGNEIGIYKYSDGDFTVDDVNIDHAVININFNNNIKQELAELYYCNVYFYYGDGNENDTIVKCTHATYNSETKTMEYENLYDMDSYYARYIKEESRGWIEMVLSKKGNIYYSNYYYYDGSCNTVYGNNSSFPAKLTVTDWNSLKPVKEITIEKPGQVFTESQLEGLSSDNVYNFFLKGADGSVRMSSGYIHAGEPDDEYDKPLQTSSPKPTASGGIIGGGVPYFPPINNNGGGGGANIQQTTAPTVQPEATAVPTAAPTANPTTVPTSAPTTQPTAVPEATAAPVATAPPEGANEPETPVINNPYVPSQEEKPVLKLKKNKITLKKGQKAKIKITSKLTTSVTYKSLKPSVATVSKKGVITAKKAGKAVITVKANGVVKKVQVTVKKAGKTEEGTESTIKTASSVKLGKDFKLAKQSITLKKDQKLTIKKASGLSGKVTFKSLDKKIASVSVNGVVKAKKKGKTTILIKKGKKTIKLKVIVKK